MKETVQTERLLQEFKLIKFQANDSFSQTVSGALEISRDTCFSLGIPLITHSQLSPSEFITFKTVSPIRKRE